jgi:hypothetical protein
MKLSTTVAFCTMLLPGSNNAMKRAAVITLALLGLTSPPTPGKADEVGNDLVAGIAMTTAVYAAKCDPLLPDDALFGILESVRTNLIERGAGSQFYVAMKYAVRMDFSQSLHDVAPVIPGDLNTFCTQMKPSIAALRESLDAGTLLQDLRSRNVHALGDTSRLGVFAPRTAMPPRTAPPPKRSTRRGADAL